MTITNIDTLFGSDVPDDHASPCDDVSETHSTDVGPNISISINVGAAPIIASMSPCDDVSQPMFDPLAITTVCPMPEAAVGVAYSQQLTATGGLGSYTWEIISGALPSGLSLSLHGVISGTTTLNETGTFTLRVTAEIGGTATKSCTLASVQVTITSTCPLPSGGTGVPYTDTLVAAGGTAPYTWSITAGSLPTGLSLATNGIISGTPTLNETQSFTLHVTDSAAHSATKTCSLSIIANGLNMTDSFPYSNTEVPPWNNIGPKFTVTNDIVGGTFNVTGIAVRSNNIAFFYVGGNGSGMVGAYAAFSTFASLSSIHPLLQGADRLSEFTLAADTSDVAIPLLTRGGPAVNLDGSAAGHAMYGYAFVFEKRGNVFGSGPGSPVGRLIRMDGIGGQTNLGSPVAASVGQRFTITAQDIGSATRLKCYLDGVLVITNDDALHYIQPTMGFAVDFCSAGADATWDDFAAATP